MRSSSKLKPLPELASTELADAGGFVSLLLGSIVGGGGCTIGFPGVTIGRWIVPWLETTGVTLIAWGAWVLARDTGTTTGVIGHLMTFLDAVDLAKTETFDLVSLNSLTPESLVGGMIEKGGISVWMLDLDIGTTGATTASATGCTTGTTLAGVADPHAISTGLSWLDPWLHVVCTGVWRLRFVGRSTPPV